MEARLKANIPSRAEAVEYLPFEKSTLDRIEGGKRQPTPDEIDKMAEFYGQEGLLYEYCSGVCPIGRKIAVKPKEKDLSGATIGLLKWVGDVQKDLGRILEIAEDNKVTADEIPDLTLIMDKLHAMWQSIATYKLYVNKALKEIEPVPAMVAEGQVPYGQKNRAAYAAR